MHCETGRIPCSLRERMECVRRRSRAQYGEDVHLLPLLLEATGGARGVFVEMGALDGFDKSNTYALERCLGWDGVLIEAEAANFERLSRRNPGRRNATMLHAAVCGDAAGSLLFYPSGRAAEGSTLVRPGARQDQAQRVSCAPLDALTRRAGYSHIDFFSLDVEGGEAAVLRHSNLSAVSVILLEDDGANRTRQDAIRGLLEGAGLVHTHALRSGRQRYGGRSQVFVQRALLRGAPPPSEPVCLAAVRSRCGSLRHLNSSFASLSQLSAATSPAGLSAPLGSRSARASAPRASFRASSGAAPPLGARRRHPPPP